MTTTNVSTGISQSEVLHSKTQFNFNNFQVFLHNAYGSPNLPNMAIRFVFSTIQVVFFVLTASPFSSIKPQLITLSLWLSFGLINRFKNHCSSFAIVLYLQNLAVILSRLQIETLFWPWTAGLSLSFGVRSETLHLVCRVQLKNFSFIFSIQFLVFRIIWKLPILIFSFKSQTILCNQM